MSFRFFDCQSHERLQAVHEKSCRVADRLKAQKLQHVFVPHQLENRREHVVRRPELHHDRQEVKQRHLKRKLPHWKLDPAQRQTGFFQLLRVFIAARRKLVERALRGIRPVHGSGRCSA